jgi:hypothetical protein
MLFRETVAVYCENDTEHTNAVWERMQSFSTLKKVVLILTTGLWRVRSLGFCFQLTMGRKAVIPEISLNTQVPWSTGDATWKACQTDRKFYDAFVSFSVLISRRSISPMTSRSLCWNFWGSILYRVDCCCCQSVATGTSTWRWVTYCVTVLISHSYLQHLPYEACASVTATLYCLFQHHICAFYDTLLCVYGRGTLRGGTGFNNYVD